MQTPHPEFAAGKFAYVADWQGNRGRIYNAEIFEKVAEAGGVTTPTGIFIPSAVAALCHALGLQNMGMESVFDFRRTF